MATTTTDRRQGVNSSAAVKVPCKIATTANITLSGTQTIDGTALAAEDRVLVKNQTDASENGIYDVKTIAWTRSPDWSGTLDVKKGTSVRVTNGTTNQGEWYVITANPIVPGTTSISFSLAQVTIENSFVVYTVDIASNSNTPNTYTTSWYDSNTVAGSGTVWTYTGTNTPARAGAGLYTDGYTYNANGDQYAVSTELNVKWFNVTGDGATDDTTQIQIVIDYAETINGSIFFPSGTYIVSTTLDVLEVISIYGDTDYSSILKFSGSSSTYCINYNHSVANVKQGQSLKYIWIDGIDKTQGRGGVYTGGNQTIVNMSQCRFQNLDICIEMHGSVGNAYSYGNIIFDCQFWLINTHAIWSYGNAEQFLIKHCWIDSGTPANTDNKAIYIQSATSGQIEGVVIQNQYDGIVLNGCKPVTIKDCHFEGNTRYNVLLEGGVSFQNESIKVEGCYMSGAQYGIALAKDSLGGGRLNYGTALISNTFTGQTVAAIHGVDGVTSATGLVIINCSWHNDFTPGAVPLIDALTPILTLSHDETIAMAAPNLDVTNQLSVAGSALFKTNTGTDFDVLVDSVVRQRWKAPASGETATYLEYHNGSAVTLQRVTLGSTDTGGAGYKVLRVPN